MFLGPTVSTSTTFKCHFALITRQCIMPFCENCRDTLFSLLIYSGGAHIFAAHFTVIRTQFANNSNFQQHVFSTFWY
jgi:hypothetical protein